MAKKAKNKKKSGACSYFLDHPQIKRNPSPGNGDVPKPAPTTPTTTSSKPGIAEQINFGGKFK
jgi:hypothetical protein